MFLGRRVLPSTYSRRPGLGLGLGLVHAHERRDSSCLARTELYDMGLSSHHLTRTSRVSRLASGVWTWTWTGPENNH